MMKQKEVHKLCLWFLICVVLWDQATWEFSKWVDNIDIKIKYRVTCHLHQGPQGLVCVCVYIYIYIYTHTHNKIHI